MTGQLPQAPAGRESLDAAIARHARQASGGVPSESGEPPEVPGDTLSRVLWVIGTIRVRLKLGLDPKGQDVLAESLSLAPQVVQANDPVLTRLYETIILTPAPTEITDSVALRMVKDLKRLLRRHNGLLTTLLRGGSPAVRVVLGLTVAFYLGGAALLLLPLYIGWAADTQLFGTSLLLLVLVGMAGAMGGVVSIMTRLPAFAAMGETDRGLLFLTGFFKPIIGLAFALFLFAVIRSGVLPVAPPDGPAGDYLYLSLAFLAGFSERLVQDITSRLEGRFTSGDAPAAGGPARPATPPPQPQPQPQPQPPPSSG